MRPGAAVLMAALAPLVAGAQELAPEQAVTPPEKPAAAADAAAVGSAGAAADAPDAAAVQPDGAPDAADAADAAAGQAGVAADQAEAAADAADPDADAADAAAAAAQPADADADAPDAEGQPTPAADDESAEAAVLVPLELAESDLELGRCFGRLDAFGTVFERGVPISEDGGACGVVNPIRVTGIVPGVALAPPAIMRCATAAALTEWVARFALPASELLPDRGRLVEVTQGTAYLCRRRNNAAEGPLSEHAFGNAVDVMGFRFASGPPIPVEPRAREGTAAAAFQHAVRAAACLSFDTVLGPGEPAHDDHLHLDVRARENGYRVCPGR